MGEVFLSEDTRLRRRIALKLLPSDFASDTERLTRFQREARAASSLNHPNIVTIHEIGEVDGRHFIATEYIDGRTLREQMILKRMALPEILDIAMGIASALVAAHEGGIIHRDIKPENVMIRHDGYVKVLDFGLAKLAGESKEPGPDSDTSPRRTTGEGQVLGTIHYMSPEQMRGVALDMRTDLFSLGVVLYEMVAGTPPFDGPSRSDVVAAVLDRQSPPLARFSREVPPELERIVHKTLSKTVEDRYQTARDLLTDLRQLRQDLEYRSRLDHGRPSGASSEIAHGIVETAGDAGAGARELGLARNTSSVEYLRTEMRRTRIGAALGIAAIVIAVSIIGYLATARRGINSIAVLPFTNLNKAEETEYLTEGLTESIIHNLSQLPQLKVMALSTVKRHSGSDDVRQVGRDLNVRAVLTGKIVQRGQTLIVQAELVDVEQGTALWGEQYNRKLSDVLAVQEDISREISEKLRLRLSGDQKSRVTKRYTENTEAFHLYLKGRYHWNKRTADGMRAGVDYFSRAIALDPNYALAWTGLADSYNLLPVYAGAAPVDFLPRGKAAVQRALELDDHLAEAHTSLGYVLAFYDWDSMAAEREFRRAIHLNPNYATAHQWYALLLAAMGRHDESIAEMRKASEVDPLSLIITTNLGTMFYLAGQYDQAEAQMNKALEMDPAFSRARYELGRVYERKKRYSDALREVQNAKPENNPAIFAAVARLQALSGRRDEALSTLQRLEAMEGEHRASPYDIAAVHEALGDRDTAFAWLEKAYSQRIARMAYLEVEPLFETMRQDPRFIDLAKRVGRR